MDYCSINNPSTLPHPSRGAVYSPAPLIPGLATWLTLASGTLEDDGHRGLMCVSTVKCSACVSAFCHKNVPWADVGPKDGEEHMEQSEEEFLSCSRLNPTVVVSHDILEYLCSVIVVIAN